MGSDPTLQWRLHLQSPPAEVFRAISTPTGQMGFWVEWAQRSGNEIDVVFPDGSREKMTVLEAAIPHRFVVRYFGSITEFDLASDDGGGTDLTIHAHEVPDDQRAEVAAGWVSVLLALKAAVDYGIDLRNHDAARTWANGYVDN